MLIRTQMKELCDRDEGAFALLNEYALGDGDKLTESALRLRKLLAIEVGKTTTRCKEEMEGLRAWAKLLQGCSTDPKVKECADFVYLTAEQALANCTRPHGNMAAIRKALEDVQNELILKPCGAHTKDRQDVVEKITTALQKPSRNCDRFDGDYERLHKEWVDWSGKPENTNPDGTVKMTFGAWLLSPYEG